MTVRNSLPPSDSPPSLRRDLELASGDGGVRQSEAGSKVTKKKEVQAQSRHAEIEVPKAAAPGRIARQDQLTLRTRAPAERFERARDNGCFALVRERGANSWSGAEPRVLWRWRARGANSWNEPERRVLWCWRARLRR